MSSEIIPKVITARSKLKRCPLMSKPASITAMKSNPLIDLTTTVFILFCFDFRTKDGFDIVGEDDFLLQQQVRYLLESGAVVG